jgi:acylphosphatase
VDSNVMVRVHILVTGRVQNVGFRAHVEYHAAQVGGITGWVRNVGLDTVEVLAEGERAKVEKFIEFVKQGPRVSRVDDVKVEYQDVSGEFKGFGVKASH